MATTITRQAMIDDSGTPASPTGDGTTINKSFMDTFMDNIDAMWSGATHVFDGLLSLGGFGTHTFDAGGTGENVIRVRNTTAGTGNKAGLNIGTDAAVATGAIEHYSTTWTTVTYAMQDGMAIVGNRPGGISIAATNASGDLRGYARGGTKMWTFNGDTLQLSAGLVGTYTLGGIIHASIDLGADGTPGNTTETTLKTWDLPAGALAVNNQGIRIVAWGDLAANANNRTVRLKFGATTLVVAPYTGAGTAGGGFRVVCDVFRTGAATQKAIGHPSANVASNFGLQGDDQLLYTAPAETLSGAVTIEVTGENAVASANDIVCHGFYVEWLGGA